MEGAACAPCPAGYDGDGITTCKDVDECASEAACDRLVECINYPGGYACTPCPPGNRGDPKVLCTLSASCVARNGGCDPLTECIPRGIASSDCGPCPPGYSGTGETSCTEIDGCSGQPCFPGVECLDDPPPSAGFTCGACPPGMTGDGESCTEEDGCAAKPCFGGGGGGGEGAPPSSVCTDVPAPGSGFLCGPCPNGYLGDGVSCEPPPCIAAPPACLPGDVCVDPPPEDSWSNATCEAVLAGPAGCPLGQEPSGRISGCAGCAMNLFVVGLPSEQPAAAPLFPRAVTSVGANCTAPDGVRFWWSVLKAQNHSASVDLAGQAVGSTAAAMWLPPGALPPGDYEVEAMACVAGALATCERASVPLHLTFSPILASVRGGDALVSEDGGPLVLDASATASEDGSVNASHLSFRWGCRPAGGDAGSGGGGAPCLDPSRAPLDLSLEAGPVLRVRLLGSAGGRGYIFRVTAAAPDGREAEVETSVVVALGPRPRATARVEGVAQAASGSYVVDASDRIALDVDVDWAEGGEGEGDTTWLVNDASLDLRGGGLTVAPWGAGSARLVLRPGTLSPGARYVFTAVARAPGGGEGQASVVVSGAVPPTGGTAAVSPPDGAALTTKFELSTYGWTADGGGEDSDFEYFWSARPVGGESAPVVLLGSPAFLPAGLEAHGFEVAVEVRASRLWGHSRAVSDPLVATVVVRPLEGAAAAEAIEAVAAGLGRLTAGGSPEQAVQQLGAIVGLVAAGQGGAAAEKALAEEGPAALRAAGEHMIPTPESRAALLDSANGLAAALSPAAAGGGGYNPSAALAECSSCAGDLAVAIVEALAPSPEGLGSTGQSGAALTPARAEACVDAFASLVASIESSPGGGAGEAPPAGGEVRASAAAGSARIADVTAARIDPGETVVLADPSGRITVVVEKFMPRGGGGQGEDGLAETVYALPDSGAKVMFGPSVSSLAGSAEAGAGPAVSPEVKISGLSFNPRPTGVAVARTRVEGEPNEPAAVVGAVLSLRVAVNGQDIDSANLEEPIQLTLALPFGQGGGAGGARRLVSLEEEWEGQEVGCAVWDDAAGTWDNDVAYIASPNPAPPGLEVASNTANGTAVPWVATIGQPLMDGCLEIDTAAGMRVYRRAPPSPGRARTVGGACELTRVNNTAMCWFDGRLQLFVGPGCEWAPTVECLSKKLPGDFAVSRGRPRIKMASAEEIKLSPQDIINIKELAAIVIAVLVIGYFLSICARHSSTRKRRKILRQLKSPSFGFQAFDIGGKTLMTWQLHSDVHVSEESDAGVRLRGPGPSLCKVMGARYNRVRLGIPFMMLPDFVHFEGEEEKVEEEFAPTFHMESLPRGSRGGGGSAGGPAVESAGGPAVESARGGGWLASPSPAAGRPRVATAASACVVEAFRGRGLLPPPLRSVRVSRVSDDCGEASSPRLQRDSSGSGSSWEDSGEAGGRAGGSHAGMAVQIQPAPPVDSAESVITITICEDIETVCVADIEARPSGEGVYNPPAVACWLDAAAEGRQARGDNGSPRRGGSLDGAGGAGPVSEAIKMNKAMKKIIKKQLVKQAKKLIKRVRRFFMRWSKKRSKAKAAKARAERNQQAAAKEGALAANAILQGKTSKVFPEGCSRSALPASDESGDSRSPPADGEGAKPGRSIDQVFHDGYRHYSNTLLAAPGQIDSLIDKTEQNIDKFNDATEDLIENITDTTIELRKKLLRGLGMKVEEDPSEEEDPEAKDARELVDMLRAGDRFGPTDRMLGTALLQAMMGLYRILDSKALLEQKMLGAKAFPAGTIPACDISFVDLVDVFTVMVEKNKKGPLRWYGRARVWTALLSQDLDGSWPVTDDVARALYARTPEDLDAAEELEDPKVFFCDAILLSEPDLLTEAVGGNEALSAVIWSTLLMLSWLEDAGYNWVIHGAMDSDDEDSDDEDEEGGGKSREQQIASAVKKEASMVSRGHDYLALQCRRPAVAAVMPELRKQALETVTRWGAGQKTVLKSLWKREVLVLPFAKMRKRAGRNAKKGGCLAVLASVGKSTARLAKQFWRTAVMTHVVLRCFLQPINQSLQRNHRVWLLVAVWMGALTVNIWLATEKAVECCMQASFYVGCGAIPQGASTCQGHSQCRTLVADKALLEGFECNAFPGATLLDALIAAFLTFCVLVPVDIVLGTLLEMSTSSAIPDRLRGPKDKRTLENEAKRIKKGMPPASVHTNFIEQGAEWHAHLASVAATRRRLSISTPVTPKSERHSASAKRAALNRTHSYSPMMSIHGASRESMSSSHYRMGSAETPRSESSRQSITPRLPAVGEEGDLPPRSASTQLLGAQLKRLSTSSRDAAEGVATPAPRAAALTRSETIRPRHESYQPFTVTESRGLVLEGLGGDGATSPRPGKGGGSAEDRGGGAAPPPAPPPPAPPPPPEKAEDADTSIWVGGDESALAPAPAPAPPAPEDEEEEGLRVGVSENTEEVGASKRSEEPDSPPAPPKIRTSIGAPPARLDDIASLEVKAAGPAPGVRGPRPASLNKFRAAAKTVAATQRLSMMGRIAGMINQAAAAVKARVEITALSLDMKNIVGQKWSARMGVIAMIITFMCYTYFIFVYGVKMYDSVGPGSEQDFIVGWITFLLMDNCVFSWKTVIKNTILKTIVSKVTLAAAMFNPVQWFAMFDDNSGDDVLDSGDLAEMAMDETEAFDVAGLLEGMPGLL